MSVVGIDLGESYARVGVIRDDVFEAISDKQNRTVIPSYVFFAEDGQPRFRFDAEGQAFENPKNAVYGVRLVSPFSLAPGTIFARELNRIF